MEYFGSITNPDDLITKKYADTHGGFIASSIPPEGNPSMLWIDLSTGGCMKYWTGSEWVPIKLQNDTYADGILTSSTAYNKGVLNGVGSDFHYIPCTRVSINDISGTLEIALGETYQFSATKTPTDATEDIFWAVSDPTKANITQAGFFTATNVGNIVVVAECDNQFSTASISIVQSANQTVVTFNANGGYGGPGTATYSYNRVGDLYYIGDSDIPIPPDASYRFEGWYDRQSGGEQLWDEDGFFQTSSYGEASGDPNYDVWLYTGTTLTVYAHWSSI